MLGGEVWLFLQATFSNFGCRFFFSLASVKILLIGKIFTLVGCMHIGQVCPNNVKSVARSELKNVTSPYRTRGWGEGGDKLWSLLVEAQGYQRY